MIWVHIASPVTLDNSRNENMMESLGHDADVRSRVARAANPINLFGGKE